MKTYKQQLLEHLRTKIIHKLQEAKLDHDGLTIFLGPSRESAEDVLRQLAASDQIADAGAATGRFPASHKGWYKSNNVRRQLMPIEHAHELLSHWRNGTNPDMVEMVRRNPKYAMKTREAMTAFADAARQHPDFKKHRYPMLLPTHPLHGMTQEEVIAHHLSNIKRLAADRDRIIKRGDDEGQFLHTLYRQEMSDLEHAKGSKPHPDEVDLSTMPPESFPYKYGVD